MAIVRLRKEAAPTQPIAGDVRTLPELLARLDHAGLLECPVDVEAIAKHLGIRVLSEAMEDDMSGFLESRAGGWVAGVNKYHHRVRQRFTLAHEIGHYVLHRNQETEFRDRTFARRNDNPSRMEREADAFAAELLMPTASVQKSVARGLRNLNDLAAEFDVSTLAMRYRLQNLGYTLT